MCCFVSKLGRGSLSVSVVDLSRSAEKEPVDYERLRSDCNIWGLVSWISDGESITFGGSFGRSECEM